MANPYNQSSAVATAGSQTYNKSDVKAGKINPYDDWGAQNKDKANADNENAKATPIKASQPAKQQKSNDSLSFLKGVLGTVKDAAVGVFNSGKNTVQNVGKVVDSTVKQGDYQTRLSATVNQQKFLNDQAKKGVITQAEADKRNAQNTSALNKTANTSLKAVQTTSKIDPRQAAADAADTALNVGTLGGESVIKSLVGEGAKVVGKDIAETTAKKTVAQTVKKVAGNSAKEAALGAGYGTSQALRSGDKKNLTPDVLLGAAIGGAVPIVGKVLGLAAEKAGLGTIAKTVFQKAADTAKQRLGRDLTEQEATNLAESTKQAVPEQHASEAESIPAEVQKGADKMQLDYLNEKAKTQVLTTGEKTQRNELKVKAAETIPASEPIHPMQEPIFTAAKAQAEKRLGRELTPAETTKLTNDTQKLVQEKFPTEPVTPVPKEVPLSEPKPTEGDTVSGNAARIEQNALEKKLTDKMGDLPQYKSINMKDQAKQAIDLVTNDRQKAIDIIDGKVNPPDGLHAQSVHQALEEVATREGDGQLLTQLAKSHVNTELSEGAQKLRIAAERDPHSAVENIRQIQETRRAVAEKRSGTTVAKETAVIKKTVAATTPKVEKETWASFVESLKC